MNILDITNRVERLLPSRMIISTTIDTKVIQSEESEDKLHQLTVVKIDKLGIILYLLKQPSTVGKPTVTSFYKGSHDSGVLLKIQDSLDLAKPRDLNDLVEESVHRLIKGELVVPDNIDKIVLNSKYVNLSSLIS